MSKMTCAGLRQKDVINLCDGSRLGYISEIEFETCTGQICAFVLCRSGGLLGFSKDPPLILPWSRIECIGEDAVLVKIPASELECFCKPNKRKERRDEL